MDIMKDIDTGEALKKAIHGDMSDLLHRLKNRYYLSDESLEWICARLEGQPEGNQKTGNKVDKDKEHEREEMLIMRNWLTNVEERTKKDVHEILSKIYSGKPDTIRKELDELEKEHRPLNIKTFLLNAGKEEAKKFLKTKDNKYRPEPLRSFALTPIGIRFLKN